MHSQVQYIFGRVASLYSDTLAATLDSLLPRGEVWEEVRRRNALYMLQVSTQSGRSLTSGIHINLF